VDFTDKIKGKKDEGKEKHVPVLDIIKGHGKEDNDFVRVVVGKEVPHPNTAEHYIKWVELYGITKEGSTVNLGRMDFEAVRTNPIATFHINNIDDFKEFCALECCNIHGVWQNCIEV
jgi:superoxide reductase